MSKKEALKKYLKRIKEEENYKKWYFFIAVLIFYFAFSFVNENLALSSLNFSFKIIKKIIPVFIFVFALMVLTNYYIHPELIKKYLSKNSGIKRWLIAIIGGIISTGPIYMWYPMLKELHKKGVGFEFVSVFLYNKAIKPFLIPVMVFYFGWTYTIIVTILMIVMSIFQGLIIDKLEDNSLV